MQSGPERWLGEHGGFGVFWGMLSALFGSLVPLLTQLQPSCAKLGGRSCLTTKKPTTFPQAKDTGHLTDRFGLFLQEQPHEMGPLGRKVVPRVARSPPAPQGRAFYILPVYTEFIWGCKGKNQTLCSVDVGGDASFHISLHPSPRREVEAFLPPLPAPCLRS